LAPRDVHAFATNSIASVENYGVPEVIANCGQFHASRSMQAKVDAYRFSAANHFALRHGELIGFEMSEMAKPLFNGRAESRVVNLAR
jgi:hypothetical protein